MKVDTQHQEGKPLNAEQLALLASRFGVEKSLAEVDAIKVQMEELSRSVSVLTLEERDAIEAAAAVAASVSASTSAVSESTRPQTPTPTTTEEASTETIFVDQVAESTQYEPVSLLSVLDDSNQDLTVMEGKIRKILKVLHVCAKYEHILGRKLPGEVDFFGKSIQGLTSVSSFSDAFDGSLRSVGYYIHVSFVVTSTTFTHNPSFFSSPRHP
jgi:hypothetical protein